MQANMIRRTIDTKYLAGHGSRNKSALNVVSMRINLPYSLAVVIAELDRHPSKPSRAPILDNYLHGY